jgi:exoribonuclease II
MYYHGDKKMNSQTIFNVYIAALICAAIVFSIAVGFCVYYVVVGIFEIAVALISEEITIVGIQLAAPEAYVLEENL